MFSLKDSVLFELRPPEGHGFVGEGYGPIFLDLDIIESQLIGGQTKNCRRKDFPPQRPYY